MVLIKKAFRKEDNMEKKIKIGDKEYTMKASAYTQFAYKNETGRSLFNDVSKISKINIEDDQLDNIESILTLVLDMAYIMIKEADSTQVVNKESFLKSIDNLFTEFDWIQEVITLALSPLSRG